VRADRRRAVTHNGGVGTWGRGRAVAPRVDRLRAINLPKPVTVELDAARRPVAVLVGKRETGNGKRQSDRPPDRLTVEFLGETWRIDDEWWRSPIARRYVEVMLDGGGRVVLYEDVITGEWWMQTP
ncbi:MAG: hypothetical protein ACRD08_05230, partial [Acidimicrobiales bacterium]